MIVASESWVAPGQTWPHSSPSSSSRSNRCPILPARQDSAFHPRSILQETYSVQEQLGRDRSVPLVERFAVKRWAAVRGRPSASTACSTAHRQSTRTPLRHERRPCVWEPRRAPCSVPLEMEILATSPGDSDKPAMLPGSSQPALRILHQQSPVRRTPCRSAAWAVR